MSTMKSASKNKSGFFKTTALLTAFCFVLQQPAILYAASAQPFSILEETKQPDVSALNASLPLSIDEQNPLGEEAGTPVTSQDFLAADSPLSQAETLDNEQETSSVLVSRTPSKSESAPSNWNFEYYILKPGKAEEMTIEIYEKKGPHQYEKRVFVLSGIPSSLRRDTFLDVSPDGRTLIVAVHQSGSRSQQSQDWVYGVDLTAENLQPVLLAHNRGYFQRVEFGEASFQIGVGRTTLLFDQFLNPVDHAAPAGTVAVQDHAAFTDHEVITLALDATDDVSDKASIRVAISVDGGITFGDFESWEDTKTVRLPEGEGEKNIVIRFMDRVGSVSEASTKIVLDQTPPAPIPTYEYSGVLTSPTPSMYASFGRYFATFDHYVVASDEKSGKVYVFENDPSSSEFQSVVAEIVNPDPDHIQMFGGSVGDAGEFVVVSGRSFLCNDKGECLGAVLYEKKALLENEMGPVGYLYFPPDIKSSGVLNMAVNSKGYLFVGDIYTSQNSPYQGDRVGCVLMYDVDPDRPTFGALIHTFVSPVSRSSKFGEMLTPVGDNILIKTMCLKGNDDVDLLFLFDADPKSETFGMNLWEGDSFFYNQYSGNFDPSVPTYLFLSVAENQMTLAEAQSEEDSTQKISIKTYDMDPSSPSFLQVIIQRDVLIPMVRSRYDFYFFSPNDQRLIQAVIMPGQLLLNGNVLVFAEPYVILHLFDLNEAHKSYGEEVERVSLPFFGDLYDVFPYLNLIFTAEQMLISIPAVDRFDSNGKVITEAGVLSILTRSFNGVTIANGQIFTKQRLVSAQLHIEDNFTDNENLTMAVSTDGGLDFSDPIPYNHFCDILLPEGDGEKEVAIRVMDQAGNTIILSDHIILDTTPPEINVTIQSINETAHQVTLKLDAQDAFTSQEDLMVGLNQVYALSGVADSIHFVPFQDEITFSFSDSMIYERKIFVQIKDQMGNISEITVELPKY